jgi:hypothetical protein
MPKLIEPSSFLLTLMIANAESKFESSREQARRRKEARDEQLEVRAQRRAAAGRLYAFIQGVR